MWQILILIFLIPFCIFTGIMVRDPRTLWSGVTFFWAMLSLALALFLILSYYSEWLMSHEAVIGVLIFLLILAVIGVLAFPTVLIILFFIEGIRIIRHEGMKPGNLLSMLFSILLFLYLAVWPMVGNLQKNTSSTTIYVLISFCAMYGLSLMAMYSLSAILNLIHLKKNRNADYIVVLGAGIIGTEVTPLLAARIERGTELLNRNPNAVLIMCGGQGPGEDIPESEAMTVYAISHGVDIERIRMEQKSISTEENLRLSWKKHAVFLGLAASFLVMINIIS